MFNFFFCFKLLIVCILELCPAHRLVFYSASYSDVDENCLSYMIMCRIIMGNVEVVHPGSTQSQPSSDKFDSGVDDLKAPKHYVIWDKNMHTHIYLEFVVTFKLSSEARGSSYLDI